MARLTKKYEAESAAAGAEAPTAPAEGDAPAADPKEGESEPKKDEPPKEPEEKPEPKETERLELEHGRALEKVRKLTSDNVALAKRLETAEADLTALRTTGKANPLKVLEQLAGDTFANIMSRAGKGEFDEQTAALPPELQQKLAKVDELLEREAKRQKEDARRLDFAADLPKVAKLLQDKAEHYPLFASLGDGPRELLTMYYDALDKGQTPNLLAMLTEFEQEGAASLTESLGNAKLVRAVLAKNPSIRTALTEALGLGKPTTPQDAAQHAEARESKEPGNTPRSVATPAEVISRSAHEQTEEEEMREAARLWRLHSQARAVTHQE
jgi:hypothetical protein